MPGARTRQKGATDALEETLIAAILGAMTLVTFAGVVVRYVFTQPWFRPVTQALDLPLGILWATELTVYLFAWLVLLGASYAVKTNAHLGVDALVRVLPPRAARACTLVAAGLCIGFTLLMLKGAWDYWANFANLPATTGRIVPTGFEQMGTTSYRAWYEVNDIPMPGFLQFLADRMNEGERYEKMPRFIPYAVLPLSMALLLLRFVQAALRVWRGEQDMIIASHEVEDVVDNVPDRRRG